MADKIALDDIVDNVPFTHREMAVLVISLGLSAGRMPGGAGGGLETIADRLCARLQDMGAPIGVVVRTMAAASDNTK